MDLDGHANSAMNTFSLLLPHHTPTHSAYTCKCTVCAFHGYLQLRQALGYVVSVRLLVHRTSQGHCCNNYKIQHIILACYKSKHWSVTESKELLENNFMGRGAEFSTALLPSEYRSIIGLLKQS